MHKGARTIQQQLSPAERKRIQEQANWLAEMQRPAFVDHLKMNLLGIQMVQWPRRAGS
tara:strand:+ start:482 stop:655 length:174 start_codon:yes stop_codon:yes gene_type:complete